MRAVLLGGAGAMGRAAAEAFSVLSRDGPIDELVIADYDLEGAEAVATALRPGVDGSSDDRSTTLGGDRSEPTDGDRSESTPFGEQCEDSPTSVVAQFVDVTDREALLECIDGADVVASAVGPFYRFEQPVASAAIEAGVPYVSLCDDHDAIVDVYELDEAAREAGVPVISGMGWTPGLSNLLARRGIEAMDEPARVRFAWAGSSKDGPGYAVILHTLHVFTGHVPAVHDGELVGVRAGTDPERVDFGDPFGVIRVSNVGHPEPITFNRVYPDIETVSMKGGLTEESLARLAVGLGRLGFTRTDARRDRLGRLFQRVLPAIELVGPSGPAGAAIRVDVEGSVGGEPIHRQYVVVDEMGAITSGPLAVTAELLADGTIETGGVSPPETPTLIDLDRFFDRLATLGVTLAVDSPPSNPEPDNCR